MPYVPWQSHYVWLTVPLLLVLLTSCNVRARGEAQQEVPTVTELPLATATERSLEHSERIRARISLPPGAQSVAFGKQSIWVSIPTERSISRIDVSTGRIVDSPTLLDFEPREIAYGEGAVWVVSTDRTSLARIDPQTNEVIAAIDLRSFQIPTYNLVLIAAGEGAVWITDQTMVIQIDPQTNQIVGQPLPAGEEIITVALGHGTFWTGSHDDGIVTRVDPRTHQVVAKIEVGFSVHGLAVDEESAWVLDEHGFAVVRIDPKSNQLQDRIPIDFVGANLAAGAGSVWVAPAARDDGRSTGNDGIARISSDEKRIVETIHAGDVPTSEYYAVYFVEGSIWVLIVTPQMSVLQIAP